MNIFKKLEEIYQEIDGKYAIQEARAISRGYNRQEFKISKKRELNDQAYFLFMFTRFEDRIKTLSEQLIIKKVASPINWSSKRTWSILNKRKDRMPFMDRVALLTEIHQANYQLIEKYYKQRNNIAHGGTFTIPIDIQIVVEDMKRLYQTLN